MQTTLCSIGFALLPSRCQADFSLPQELNLIMLKSLAPDLNVWKDNSCSFLTCQLCVD